MTKSWEKHKAAIISLYKAENRPLHEVQTLMRERYNFGASIRAYRTRFGKWNLHKYNARRRHSVATYLARSRHEPSPPSSPTIGPISPASSSSVAGIERSVSQACPSRTSSLPSLSALSTLCVSNYYPTYGTEILSAPMKYEPPYRPASEDMSQASEGDYYVAYGSGPTSLYHAGSPESYCPRSTAIPLPQIGYNSSSMSLYTAVCSDDAGLLCEIMAGWPQAAACALDSRGSTALHVAVAHRSSAVVPQLLLCTSANQQDSSGDTPIHCLFREAGWWRDQSMLAMAQKLLRKADANVRNLSGESPLDVLLAQLQAPLSQTASPASPEVPTSRVHPVLDGNCYLIDAAMVTILDWLTWTNSRSIQMDHQNWQRAVECLCRFVSLGARPDSTLRGKPILSYLLSHPAETEAFGHLSDFTYQLVERADPGATDQQGWDVLHHALDAKPQACFVARQRWAISRLISRKGWLGLPDHGRRLDRQCGGAISPPSPLLIYARSWSHDDEFLETSMKLVEAGADTRPLTPTTEPGVFSRRLVTLATAARDNGGGDDGSEDDENCNYNGEGRLSAGLDVLRSTIDNEVPLFAAVWVSACGQDSWTATKRHLRVLYACAPPSGPMPGFYERAFKLLATKFLDSWAQRLRTTPHAGHAGAPAMSDLQTTRLAQDYDRLLRLCAKKGEYMRADRRHYDLRDELPYFSQATGEPRLYYARR